MAGPQTAARLARALGRFLVILANAVPVSDAFDIVERAVLTNGQNPDNPFVREYARPNAAPDFTYSRHFVCSEQSDPPREPYPNRTLTS